MRVLRIARVQLVLIVAVVALLGLGVLFAVQYIGALGKTPQLEDEIAKLNSDIAKMETCNVDDANNQLEECLNKLEDEDIVVFPAPPFDDGGPYDQKEITDAIFDLTDDAKVYLESLDHKGDSRVKLVYNEYRADEYKLKCSTDINDEERLITMLRLFEDMREELYKTLVIDNLKFTDDGLSVQFDLAILTQSY